MTKICIFRGIFPVSLLFLATIHGFSQSISAEISNSLVAAGYENVRVIANDTAIFLSFEDNLYRWNVDGIQVALDSIAIQQPEKAIRIVVLKKGVPQIEIRAPDLHNNQTEITNMKGCHNLECSYEITDTWAILKAVAPVNPPEYKIDLVVYPRFALQNTLLTQIYEIQLNIAPAIEVQLWKGMLFTGQVIFPVVNQLDVEGDYIRPGFVTLSQEFRFLHRCFGWVTLGNFNANRYGTDVSVNLPLYNRWMLGVNAGLTGYSYFYAGQWFSGELNTLTWFLKAQYFYPRFNLQLDVSYGQYIYTDRGFRVDCTRHFAETTVGFYAMCTGGELNGGFHFTIPLPPTKRNRRHMVRIMPPRYFDWEYNAGTEFYYGRYYETRPNENRTEYWYNQVFIENELNKTN